MTFLVVTLVAYSLFGAFILGVSPFFAVVPSLVIALIAVLAWQRRGRILWWLGTVCATVGAVGAAYVFYGIIWIEIELTSPIGIAHLLVLPCVTIAAAAVSWWGLSAQPGGQATRIGQTLS